MRSSHEAGDTIQFTWVSSVDPDSNPVVKIYGNFGSADTVIASLTSITSASMNYYAVWTAPASPGVYMVEWYAVKTIVSSTYPFVKRDLFNVVVPAIEL